MKSQKVWRDETITARVTAEEKKRIKEKARKEGKSASQYVTDTAMAGLERRSSKDKKRVNLLINKQDLLNEILEKAQEEKISGELYELITRLAEEENKLWQCL